MKNQLLRCGVAFVDALAANGDTPLHVAMRLSDENRCLIITKLLVEAGCSPHECDADNRPPIYAAVARGFVSVVEYLLSQDVPLPSRILFTALQSTVVKRVEMIRLLVSKGANVHVLNPDGDTLLHANMRSLNRSVCLEIAEMLIDIGCDPLVRNLHGQIPLQIAAKQGHHEAVNYLLSFSSSLGISSLLKGDPAAQVPILRSLLGHADGLRFQLKEEDRVFQGVRPFIDNKDQCLELAKIFIGVADDRFARIPGGECFFDIATRRGFNKVVEYLTSKTVPLPPAILFTALRHQVWMIPSLIRNGANLHVCDDNGDTLVHVSVSILTEYQCRRTTELLVKAGCDPFTLNSANQQPIQIAASRGFVSVVLYLLSRAFDIKVSLPLDLSKRDCLPLVYAVLKSTIGDDGECLRTMQLFSTAGCIPFALDADRETPLHIVISRGFTSIIDCLLSQDPPLPSGILFFAFALQSQPLNILYHGDPDKWIPIISSLVRKGANLGAQDPHQNTALHCAMRMTLEGHCLEATRIFIEAGCSTSVRNTGGELPIQVAVARRRSSVVEYLLSHNAPFPSDILFTVLRRKYDPVMVSLFVEHGADVSAISADGDTVLHVALAEPKPLFSDRRHALDAVNVLVRAGCNMHVCDALGRTPLKLARDRGYYEVGEYLQRASSSVSQSQSSFVPSHPPLQNPVSPPPGSTSPSLRTSSLLPVTPPPLYHSPQACPPPFGAPIHPPPPPLPQRPLLQLGDVRWVISGLLTPFSTRQTEPDNSGMISPHNITSLVACWFERQKWEDLLKLLFLIILLLLLLH